MLTDNQFEILADIANGGHIDQNKVEQIEAIHELAREFYLSDTDNPRIAAIATRLANRYTHINPENTHELDDFIQFVLVIISTTPGIKPEGYNEFYQTYSVIPPRNDWEPGFDLLDKLFSAPENENNAAHPNLIKVFFERALTGATLDQIDTLNNRVLGLVGGSEEYATLQGELAEAIAATKATKEHGNKSGKLLA